MMTNLITIWRGKFLYFLIQEFSCYHARLRAGIFLIQQSTAGGLSYKVKKAVNSAHLQAPVPPWETHQKNVSCVLVS